MENHFLEMLRLRRPGCPVVIAHRGDSFHSPENTLEAARSARPFADAWELDVQLTRDGIPVVIHDDSLMRVTNVTERFATDPRSRDGFLVCDFDYKEIATLEAGAWFVADEIRPRSARAFGTFGQLDPLTAAFYRSGGSRIPTLDEALALTVELDWLVNVEIKAFPLDPPGLTSAVLDAIDRTASMDRVLISSFDHRVIRTLANIRDGERTALGILMDTPLSNIPNYVGGFQKCDTVHVSAESLGTRSVAYRRSPGESMLRRDEVEALGERDIPVLVYTVNGHGEGSEANHLAGIGVSGLFTDDPRGMRRSLEAGDLRGPV